MASPERFDELFQKHRSTVNGLTTAEAQQRMEETGPNFLRETQKKSLFLMFLGEFKDLMVLLLIGAGIIALLGGEKGDATVIILIVVLNALIGFVQEFKADKAIEALRQMVAPKAKVIRDGKDMEIDAKLVVPGDILIIQEGDRIAADAVLFETNELETQESILTGESVPVRKTAWIKGEHADSVAEMKDRVFMGTMSSHGNGKAIVFATGMQTEMGKIAELTTSTQKDKSPLEKEFFRIGVFVGKVSIGLSVILLLIGYFWQGKNFVDTLLFAVSVAVAAVPEGLPATITIALAIGVQRLVKKNAIVKQLSSVETLGATTVICSDKTGTLTKNEMTVKELRTNGMTINIHGSGYAPEGEIRLPDAFPAESPLLERMMATAGLCNNARLALDHKSWKVLGDPTEGALLSLVEKSAFPLKKLQERYEKVREFPFDSGRKRMSVIVKEKATGKYFVLVKGAADGMLEVSSHIERLHGRHTLTEAEKNRATEENDQMAKNALRTLGFAYRELSKEETELVSANENEKLTHEKIERDLLFLGLTGIIDPPRPEVKRAVELAQKAGIRTYIITGDHGLTAEAIARQLGMIGTKSHRIITGIELAALSDRELTEKLADKELDIIFARVSPENKLRIVSLLKDAGEIVAVTGDGVNDAPALKRADIGIAMGITGTDVSKEAANMILADDSYSTIVSAIKEGRTIYGNLKKFVFYVFSCNIGELFIIFSAILLGMPAPLTATLILCVDVGTDVLPAVALGVDPAEPGIMSKKPRDAKKRIMNKNFVLHYTVFGIIIGCVVMAAYFWTLKRYGWEWGMKISDDSFMHIKGMSMAFAMLVIIQMVNAFNSRSKKYSVFTLGFFSNLHLVAAVCVSLLFTVAVLEIPFLQNHLHTASLDAKEWGVIALGSLLIFVVEEARKLIMRLKG